MKKGLLNDGTPDWDDSDSEEVTVARTEPTVKTLGNFGYFKRHQAVKLAVGTPLDILALRNIGFPFTLIFSIVVRVLALIREISKCQKTRERYTRSVANSEVEDDQESLHESFGRMIATFENIADDVAFIPFISVVSTVEDDCSLMTSYLALKLCIAALFNGIHEAYNVSYVESRISPNSVS